MPSVKARTGAPLIANRINETSSIKTAYKGCVLSIAAAQKSRAVEQSCKDRGVVS